MNQYMADPRTINSSGGTVSRNKSGQLTSIIDLLGVEQTKRRLAGRGGRLLRLAAVPHGVRPGMSPAGIVFVDDAVGLDVRAGFVLLLRFHAFRPAHPILRY